MQTMEQVRCAQCGHESDSRYRFCGMCGSRLPQPSPPPSNTGASRPAQERYEAVRPVSGPSFLGLADEPGSHAAYLLEDDASPPHWGRVLFLLLLLGVAAGAAWQWRGNIRALALRETQRPTTSAAQSQPESTTYQASPISTSGSEVAGSMPNAQTMTQTPAPETAQPATPAPQPSAPPSTDVPAQASASPPPQQSQAATEPAKPPAETSAANHSPDNKNQSAENGPVVPAKTSEKEISQSAASGRKATPAIPAAAEPGQSLEAEGERYLYGIGTPANCAHAQKSLLSAAAQSNAKAASVLATMYATGHCASRDLPTSYSWFAKAMQLDPANPRLEKSLMMVWNQMSPDERQLAIHHRQ